MQPARFPLLARVDASFIIASTTKERKVAITQQRVGRWSDQRMVILLNVTRAQFYDDLVIPALVSFDRDHHPTWRNSHYLTTTEFLAKLAYGDTLEV